MGGVRIVGVCVCASPCPSNSGSPIPKSSVTGFTLTDWVWCGVCMKGDRESSSTLYPLSFR